MDLERLEKVDKLKTKILKYIFYKKRTEKEILKRFENIKITKVSHEEFKKLTKESKAVVRTGECSPYANIILKSGVVF